MAHAFQTIPAKPTFGTIQPIIYQSDYLNIKKRQILSNIRCSPNLGYNYYYLLYKPSYVNQINPFNLNYGLYSQENLTEVNTLARNNALSVPVNTTNPSLTPFYNYYTIDPQGQLFGNSPCGQLNYVNYMQPAVFYK
uniref:Uncharacterized protein n=1 Tax=viral metagenome TaxID=1070528 RepID=A0A6C0E361_9ZZZZ